MTEFFQGAERNFEKNKLMLRSRSAATGQKKFQNMIMLQPKLIHNPISVLAAIMPAPKTALGSSPNWKKKNKIMFLKRKCTLGTKRVD